MNTHPLPAVAGIACPVAGAILIIVSRRSIGSWLQAFVPQKSVTKIHAAVHVAAFAVAAFVAGWILAVLVPDSPPPVWLSMVGVALLGWIVAWALLANEN
ncbi:hypothetical protein IT072_04325 [Leifsonia sp. ZF2019]|uniref:hypothetical protein n=1 Tax=Leifsonia sp. ZF2019 TaxID=2781978 RepID=UPI001CBD4887|nr:hypothetical protein [Leifsonia sp. ZF2019]UAJ80281.1 hypothetical protein IT072_04325 [Leifsonia sp. ZF2019]